MPDLEPLAHDPLLVEREELLDGRLALIEVLKHERLALELPFEAVPLVHRG